MLCVHMRATRLENRERILFRAFENNRPGKWNTKFVQPLRRFMCVDKDKPSLGILQNICNLIGCLRRKHRYDDAAGKKGCKVRHDPIDAVGSDQCNTVARVQTGVANGARQIRNAREQLVAGRRRPRAVDAFYQNGLAFIRQRPADQRGQRFSRKRRTVALHATEVRALLWCIMQRDKWRDRVDAPLRHTGNIHKLV